MVLIHYWGPGARAALWQSKDKSSQQLMKERNCHDQPEPASVRVTLCSLENPTGDSSQDMLNFINQLAME